MSTKLPVRTCSALTLLALADLRQDKLIRAGQGETTNPDKLEDFVRELVKVGIAELRKEGVIAGEPSGRQS